MTELRRARLLIGGEWVDAAGGATELVLDPATAEPLAEVAAGGSGEAEAAARAARNAFVDGWPWPAPERAALLARLADAAREHSEELAQLETRDVGKPLAEARASAAAAAGAFTHFGAFCAHEPELNRRDAEALNLTAFVPVGVVAHVLPWNFPTSMTANRVAMTIATGCTTVLKPSPLAPLGPLRIAELCEQAGTPAGVVNLITGGAEAGRTLAESRLVDKISFTGSTAAGRDVMARAAGTLKRVTLELGGKAPVIVFADADLELAARGACFAAFANQGESCSAGSRLLVERDAYEEVRERLVALARSIRLGAGVDPETEMGPLISAAHRDRVAGYVRAAKGAGARVLTGGPARGDHFARGFFYLPTVIDQVAPSFPIMREEIFGPVVCLLPFEGEDEAVALANDSEYGLCASVWTGDPARGQRVIDQLDVGIAWLNTACLAPPYAPWGGLKQSGVGRILGRQGLAGYLEPKQVHVQLSPARLGAYHGPNAA